MKQEEADALREELRGLRERLWDISGEAGAAIAAYYAVTPAYTASMEPYKEFRDKTHEAADAIGAAEWALWQLCPALSGRRASPASEKGAEK